MDELVFFVNRKKLTAGKQKLNIISKYTVDLHTANENFDNNNGIIKEHDVHNVTFH